MTSLEFSVLFGFFDGIVQLNKKYCSVLNCSH